MSIDQQQYVVVTAVQVEAAKLKIELLEDRVAEVPDHLRRIAEARTLAVGEGAEPWFDLTNSSNRLGANRGVEISGLEASPDEFDVVRATQKLDRAKILRRSDTPTGQTFRIGSGRQTVIAYIKKAPTVTGATYVVTPSERTGSGRAALILPGPQAEKPSPDLEEELSDALLGRRDVGTLSADALTHLVLADDHGQRTVVGILVDSEVAARAIDRAESQDS